MTGVAVLIGFAIGSGIGYYIGFNQAAHPGKIEGMLRRLFHKEPKV